MKRHILSKLIQGLLALLALSFVVFLSAHATGDAASYLLSPDASTREDYERLQRVLGLDLPLHEQYLRFLQNALRGDLGMSFQHRRPVAELLMERLPATLELAITALAASILLGVPLGVWAALKRNTVVDRVVTASAIFSMAAPSFWVGIMLITLFAGSLNWLPAFGRGEPVNLVLPVTTLVLSMLAGVVRLVRSSMLEVLTSDYIRFARLKGLSDWQVNWRHALKNALIPVVTFGGIMLGSLLNGTIVVEQVFAWPGLGRLTLEAVTTRNVPLLQGAVLLAGFFYITSALMVDILYSYLDPRIRYGHDDK